MQHLRKYSAKKMRWQVGDQRSFEHRFTQEQVDAYAKLVGDHNPMHVDPEYTREVLGDAPVVHGMFAASFVSTLIGMYLPGPGALWQSFQVNWRKSIRPGDLIRFDAKVASTHDSTKTIDLEVTGTKVGSGEVCLDGKGRVMIVEKEECKQEEQISLKDQRIIVTGASGELGAAVCRELAGHGARLIALGRNEERLSNLKVELGKTVERTYAFDLKDANRLTAAVDEVTADGAVFGLVHVAAPSLTNLDVIAPEMASALQEQWHLNVLVFHQIVERLARIMPRGASIVHVLTQYVIDAPPAKLAHYVSAKSAALALVKSMALELGPKGIRCNAVSPGMMNTAYSKDVPLRIKQTEAAGNPLRRLCSVQDVAKGISFLLGPEAAFINGINLPITGGGRMP